MEPNLENAIDETAAYLESPEARASLRADPYWPKWESPWWRMVALHEMGLTDRIPDSLLQLLVESISTSYLRFFPTAPGELPAGADPYRHVACHCALGTVYAMLTTRRVDLDALLPWVRPWFLRYQLPDGGLNCDEAAYLKSVPRSSIVSTLPPLEALLAVPVRSAAEEAFLDRGAAYLIAHRLVRSVSKGGGVIDAAWLTPSFPRFYFYDILRGASFLARWAKLRGRPLPPPIVQDIVASVPVLPDGRVRAVPPVWRAEPTLRQDGRGDWTKGHASGSFALLEQVSETGVASIYLSRIWSRTAGELGV